MENDEYIWNYFKEKLEKEGNTFEIISAKDRPIGKGAYGEVRKVKYKIQNEAKGRNLAAKLIEIKRNNENNEPEKVQIFRGPGIVKINKVIKEKINSKNYCLIIMEEASLSNLNQFNINLTKKELNIIFKEPLVFFGENLLIFFTKQLIHGLEILNRNNFHHFDIKPENILIFPKLILKWTDFGFLRSLDEIKIDNTDKVNIPGGTRGYLSPEFYQCLSKINKEDAIKQDFFALGATIYFMKYREKMLDYKEFRTQTNDEENYGKFFPMNAGMIIDLLERVIDKIKSDKNSDPDFIKFLCRLIHYKPGERPNFEEIYRNKWVNKHSKEIKDIAEINSDFRANKMIIEFDKSDFLIKKKEYIYKKREESKIYHNKKNSLNKHKFIFKSKKKN